MKIQVCSDLHLERYDLTLPGGEVLVLAGDVMEAKELGRNNYTSSFSLKEGANANMREDRFLRFMHEEVTKYEKVFYVAGNHEHWGTKMYKTHAFMRDNVPPNTTVLENEICNYRGVLFLGATFWTDFNKFDSLTMFHAGQGARDGFGMKDYKYITVKHRGIYRKAIPNDILEIHRKSKEYFNLILSENRQKENPLPVVVITHHAPCALSIPDVYKDDYLMNGCYYSDQSNMILDNPQIKFWIHGHIHSPIEYNVGDATRVVCNPRGYYGYETQAFNYAPVELEIDSSGITNDLAYSK